MVVCVTLGYIPVCIIMGAVASLTAITLSVQNLGIFLNALIHVYGFGLVTFSYVVICFVKQLYFNALINVVLLIAGTYGYKNVSWSFNLSNNFIFMNYVIVLFSVFCLSVETYALTQDGTCLAFYQQLLPYFSTSFLILKHFINIFQQYRVNKSVKFLSQQFSASDVIQIIENMQLVPNKAKFHCQQWNESKMLLHSQEGLYRSIQFQLEKPNNRIIIQQDAKVMYLAEAGSFSLINLKPLEPIQYKALIKQSRLSYEADGNISTRLQVVQGYHLMFHQNRQFSIRAHRHAVLLDTLAAIIQTSVQTHGMQLSPTFINCKNYSLRSNQILFLTQLAQELLAPFAVVEQEKYSTNTLSTQESEQHVNQNVVLGDRGYVVISRECSRTHAYVVGWLIAQSFILNIPLGVQISRLLISLAANIQVSLSDLSDFDSNLADQIHKAEISERDFQSFFNNYGNIRHHVIKVLGQERRLQAIDIQHLCEIRYFSDSKTLRCLRAGFSSVLSSQPCYFVDTETIYKVIGQRLVTVPDLQLNTILQDVSKSTADLFFEILRKNQKLALQVFRLCTGLRSASFGGCASLNPTFTIEGGEAVLFDLDEHKVVLPEVSDFKKLERLMKNATLQYDY